MDWCRGNGGNPGNFYDGAGNYTGWGCHPIPGQWKCDGSSPSSASTGSLVGDTLNLGANLWIIQNVKNPYSAVFLQNFSKGFLTGLFSNNAEGQRQQELMQNAIRVQQLEAIEKARLAEKQRIDAIFMRLNSELKLSNASQLILKTNSGTGDLFLKLSGVTNDGRGLPLKIGDGTQSAGIKGLPGIYVGGPANPSAGGGLQLKLGQGNEAAAAPAAATTSMGIPGLPGIYLDNVQPSQAADLANAAINLSEAGRRVAEEAALAAAQKNPHLTQPSDDPFVQDYQKDAQEYATARQSQHVAWQAAAEAEGHVQAEKTAIDYVRSQVDPAHVTQEQTQAIQDMLSSKKSDEEMAANARQMFEQADIHLSTVRHNAADSLAVLAAPGNTGTESQLTGDLTLSATASAKTTSLLNGSFVPVIDPGHARVPILSAPRSDGRPFSEGIEACVARFAAAGKSNGPVPSLEELQRKLEADMTAIERLAKSQEENNDELKEWSKELRKAHLDMTINGVDALLIGLLNVTKTNLEIDQSMVKTEIRETRIQAQELRKEVVATGEQIAAGGDPALLTTLRVKVDKIRSQALPLIERRELLKRELENTEKWSKLFENISYPRDLGLWLTDSTIPCNFDEHGAFTCQNFNKNNAISKWAQGDLLPRLDLLKQALKFGAHNMSYWKRFSRAGQIGEAVADIAGRATFIEQTWDLTSLVIDDLYDGTAIYLSHQRLQKARQNNAQLESAELMLGERIDRLHAQIACYQKSNPNTAELGR